MNSNFKDLLLLFTEHEVEYLLVGGYAYMQYAEPRYTKDLDLWVNATPSNATRVFTALAKFGAPLGELTIKDFSEPDGVYQMGIAPFRVDVLLEVSGLTFEEARINHHQVLIGDIYVPVISKADLIENKKAAGRPQDLVDVQVLLSDGKKVK